VSSPILAHRHFVRATVINFTFFLSFNAFVLLPLHIQELGGTEIEIGVLMGLYSAIGIVSQPLIGPWVDAIGRRLFMLLGTVLVLAAAVLAALFDSIPVLASVRVLQGFGFSAYFVAMFSYVVDLVPPAQRGWALGIYGVSGLLATALAPLMGEWVIRSFGFRPLFILCAALTAVAALFVVTLREPARAARTPEGFPWERGALDELLRRHMAVTVFFGLGTGAIFAFLPTFAVELGVRTLALFYTAYSAAAMAVRVFGGELIDTRGRRAVIVPSMFLQAAATSLLAALGLTVNAASDTPALPILFVAGLMSGAAHGFLYPSLAALVADAAPATRRASVVGIFSAVFLIGNAAGAFLFGYVTHATGYGPMWAALTAALFLGALISLGLDASVSEAGRRELSAPGAAPSEERP
jgi:MFS family permease